MEPLFSTDALLGCLDENEVEATTEKVEASVLLNELSRIIGTPLFAVAFPLKESSGFAIFLCEATPRVENGIVKYFSGASHDYWLARLECSLRLLSLQPQSFARARLRIPLSNTCALPLQRLGHLRHWHLMAIR